MPPAEIERTILRGLEGVWREAAYAAWAETHCEGRLAARTVVEWPGRTHAVFAAGIPEAMARQHTARAGDEARFRLWALQMAALGAKAIVSLHAAAGNPVLLRRAIEDGTAVCRKLAQRPADDRMLSP
jgi:hypothetical protein